MFGSVINTIGNVATTLYNSKQAATNAATQTMLNLYADNIMRKRDAMQTAYYWHKYNSPSAQMQAYSDAGLNPNLIYGQNNQVNPVHSGGNVAGDIPFTPFQAPQFGSLMDMYFKVKEDKRQDAANAAYIANLDASARAKNVQSTNDAIRGDLLAQQKVLNELRIEYDRTTNPLRRKFLETQMSNINQQMERDLWQRGLEERKFGLDQQRFYESVRQFKSNDEFRRDPANRLNPWAQVGMKLVEELSGRSLKQGLKDLWNSTKNSLNPFSWFSSGAGSGY